MKKITLRVIAALAFFAAASLNAAARAVTFQHWRSDKMKKFLCCVLVLVILSVAAAAFADENDDSVEGLWLEVPGFPKNAEVSHFRIDDEGVVFYMRVLEEGAVVLAVERLKNVMGDGSAFTMDKVAKFVAGLENMEEDDIDVDENPDELTAIFKNKYPVAAATYTTGEEETRMEADIFIFTDDWVFRVDFSIASESAEKYAPQIEGWCNSMKLRDGGGGAKEAEARDAEAKDAGVKGLWVELPGLPESSQTVFTAQSRGEGPAYFERTIDDGKLVVSIERVYRENNKGEERGPDDAGKLTAELELLRKEREIGEDDMNVTESIEELAEL